MASTSLNSALSHFYTCSEQTSLFIVLWYYSRQKMSTDSGICITLQSNILHVIGFFRHIKFCKMVATAYPKQVAWHYAATVEFSPFLWWIFLFPILEALCIIGRSAAFLLQKFGLIDYDQAKCFTGNRFVLSKFRPLAGHWLWSDICDRPRACPRMEIKCNLTWTFLVGRVRGT